MKKIYLILLFFSLLAGCQPSKESPVLFAALQKVECMIEQDSFPAKYVIMYEVTSNDIGSIYQITSTDSPFVEWSLERPERVIKYKDKYICLISPMASTDISKEKLLKMTNYQNDTIGPIRNEMWYIGVSKDGKKQSLVSTHITYLTSRFYTFPKLLEYVFNGYDEVNLPRFVLGMYSLVVDTSYTPKEAFRDHIQYIEGDIYYTNPFDEYFTENKDSIHSPFFAVLNGKDTLKLNITDTIMQCLFFESMNNPIFFKSLPQQESWYKLYNLLRDSTFYFQNEKGKYIKYSIPFGDTYWLFGVKDSLGHNLYDLYKRGVKENLKNIESFDEWDSN